MYSAYKQGGDIDSLDNRQMVDSSPILNQSVVPCLVLTVFLDLYTGFSGDRKGGLVFPLFKRIFYSLL